MKMTAVNLDPGPEN